MELWPVDWYGRQNEWSGRKDVEQVNGSSECTGTFFLKEVQQIIG